MKVPNDLIHAINSLSAIYHREQGRDVAMFLTFESKLQWRYAQRCRTCDHYGDDRATHQVSVQAYLVFERYLQIQNYKSLKEDLKSFDNIEGE